MTTRIGNRQGDFLRRLAICPQGFVPSMMAFVPIGLRVSHHLDRLRRLASRGLVTLERNERRHRTVVRITAAGRRVLDADGRRARA